MGLKHKSKLYVSIHICNRAGKYVSKYLSDSLAIKVNSPQNKK